ncbi:MAG TPA: insulinase family protein, partial [Saprospiraceae bacterium]|nr:insulinase family protein [Saprospiraceae bacterium]
MIKNIFILTMLVVAIAGCTPKMSPSSTAAAKTTPVAPVPAPAPTPPPAPAPLPNAGDQQMSAIPMDPKVRIGKLPNGMTYYIRQNNKPENRAELRLAVSAGSMEEDDDQLGLAHLIEHMAFNGSTNFSKNELVDYLEKVGSRFGPDLNAYTNFDETVYMLQIRTDDQEQFDKGMLILKDWSSGVTFDSTEIEKERGVVVSEWRSGLSPDQRMQDKYFPFLYYNSRYAKRLTIGKPEIINTAPKSVITRFYNDWYRPELMAVMVVGTVDPDKVEKQIQSMFSDVKAKTMARKKAPHTVPDHPQTFVRIETDHEATNASVDVIYKHRFSQVKTLLDYRDRLEQQLYNRMLGRRLNDMTKLANPPFIFAGTGYGQDVGDLATYSSFAIADPKDIKRAFQVLMDENQRVLQHGFTQSELDREKANIMRQAEQNVAEEDKMESNRVVSKMVGNFLDNNPIPNAQQTMDMYKSMLPTITVDEISQLAKQWITKQSRVIIVTGPEKDKAMLPDSVELIALMNASASKNMDAYSEVDLSAPLLVGNFPPQAITKQSHDTLLNVYHWEFANGVTVTAKPTEFKNDEILMTAYSPGGSSLYNDDMFPSARSASNVIGTSGVGNYNAAALEKKLTGIRAGASPFIFERYEGINGSSSVKDKETMMQLIYSYLVKYREDTVALSAYISRERSTLANLLANPNVWFSDRVNRVTSSNHPRRRIPTMESYDKIKMADIMTIYRDRFGDLNDLDFFFVGNFNPDTLKILTSRYLGALPGAGRKETWKDIGDRYPQGRVDSTYYRGEAPKSLVQYIFHGADKFNVDSSYLLQSLIDIARIKLREELREEEGGVYGVAIGGGQTKFPVEQYSIRISYNVDPPRTQELDDACLAVVRKLKTAIDPADIVKITEAQRQGRIKDLQQNQFWMNTFVN